MYKAQEVGGSGSWPSPQYRGAVGPGGDGGELEGRGPIQRGGHLLAILPCRNECGLSVTRLPCFQRECGIHLFIFYHLIL